MIPKAKALAEYPFGKPDPSSLWIIGVLISASGKFAPDGTHIKWELNDLKINPVFIFVFI